MEGGRRLHPVPIVSRRPFIARFGSLRQSVVDVYHLLPLHAVALAFRLPQGTLVRRREPSSHALAATSSPGGAGTLALSRSTPAT